MGIKKRYWLIFHKKYLQKRKLNFMYWFFEKFPGKYCWADCVMWSMDSKRLNPFRIDSSKGCETESLEREDKSCYCGSWDNGQCWQLLTKEEQERIKAERKAEYEPDEIPF